MPTWAYTFTGRIVWKMIPVVLRTQLAAHRHHLAALGVIGVVLLAGLALARADRVAGER